MPKRKPSPSPELMTLVLGSRRWIEAVFEADPTRAVLGRSRATQRNVCVDRERQTAIAVEGRLENMAFQILEWLHNQRLIKRFKTQPFKLTESDDGVNATPDFLFEDMNGKVYVLETKPVYSLTAEEKCQQDSVARVIEAAAQMKFVLWTDEWPLTRTVYHNLWNMRRAAKIGFSEAEISKVIKALQKRSISLEEFKRIGISSDLVHAATYRSLAFFNFFQPVNEQTYVHGTIPSFFHERLFAGWCSIDVAWERMSHRVS